MQGWKFAVAFYIFLWPFVLLMICVGVAGFVPRRHLIKASSALAIIAVLSAAPLAYSVSKSDPFLNGIAISSLSLYPVILVVLAVTLLLRGAVIWIKGARPGKNPIGQVRHGKMVDAVGIEPTTPPV